MPIYNKTEIGREAQQYGFVRDTFEKVLRLKEIIKYFNEEECLRERKKRNIWTDLFRRNIYRNCCLMIK